MIFQHLVAANRHPDHDTIAKFSRANIRAFELAFKQILLLAAEPGLLKVSTVRYDSADGTKVDTNTSKIKSIRDDRLQALWAKLETA